MARHRRRHAITVILAAFARVVVAAPSSASDRPAAGESWRPVIAVVAANAGTETTDFLVPYGILSASGVAEVISVSTRPGPVVLMPAVRIEAETTIASFDERYPAGANVVVVPAVHDRDDPTLRAWVQKQAGVGATVVAICDGAWVLAGAGLLDGRRATSHWYSIGDLAEAFPRTHWVSERRFVRDGDVMTTAGVTASLPASVALVEHIGGTAAAAGLAARLGIDTWDAHHGGRAFALDTGHVATAARNWLAFWNHERIGIPVADGVDEIALGLAADGFGRTYRSSALTVAPSDRPVTSRGGLRILPDVSSAQSDRVDRVYALPDVEPGRTLDAVLGTLAHDYGAATARFVALQLEYPWSGAPDR